MGGSKIATRAYCLATLAVQLSKLHQMTEQFMRFLMPQLWLNLVLYWLSNSGWKKVVLPVAKACTQWQTSIEILLAQDLGMEASQLITFSDSIRYTRVSLPSLINLFTNKLKTKHSSRDDGICALLPWLRKLFEAKPHLKQSRHFKLCNIHDYL